MHISTLNLGQLFAAGPAYSLSTGSMRIPCRSLHKNSQGAEVREALDLIVPAAVWGVFVAQHGRLQKGDALEITASAFRVEPRGYHDATLVVQAITLHRAPPRHASGPAVEKAGEVAA